jgi:uncharacterized OsmC-like protein
VEERVNTQLEFSVTARRVDASGSLAMCKEATLTIDTALAGRRDALNPAELLLTALSACMIKGIERVAPMLTFSFRGVEVRVHGIRQDVPPRMERIDYEIPSSTIHRPTGTCWFGQRRTCWRGASRSGT